MDTTASYLCLRDLALQPQSKSILPSPSFYSLVSRVDNIQGLVLYSFAVALALIFNQYVNPIALTKLKWHC
jgi:hypothetical protein